MTAFFKQWKAEGWRAALLGGTTLRHAGRLEGFFLRALFAMVVWRSLENYPSYPTLPHPVGLAEWSGLWQWLGWDLTRLSDAAFWAQCLLWSRVALAFYTMGFGLSLALPVVTLVHVGIRTLNNSQGAAHHGFQMVSLALVTQMLVVWLLAAVRMASRVGRRPVPAWAAPGNWTWLWIYTIAVAAATYLVSVCSKIDESKGQWLKNSPYVATQIVKTHRQNYYNNLDPGFIRGVPPAPADPPDPANDRYRHPVPAAADWLSRHPSLARLVFGSGFFLEMFAFLALIDRRAALVVGLGLVTLHGSVEWLMELTFPFNQRVVALYFVNAAGWAVLMARDPVWQPGKKLWAGSFLASALLLGLHLATAGTDTISAHFLQLTQEAAAVVPDLFSFPVWLKWPTVLATQTVILSALVLTVRSLWWPRNRNRKNPAALPTEAGK